jgi:hypothetical protein
MFVGSIVSQQGQFVPWCEVQLVVIDTRDSDKCANRLVGPANSTFTIHEQNC